MQKPQQDLKPNTYDFETTPFIIETGFREYDARWQINSEINAYGFQALGQGLGTFINRLGVLPEIIVGHDFRSYSQSVKQALIIGLMNAGIKVTDIGLALSPMAYFAQFELKIPCVAMVTASHNENGWTGVKMGANRPLTFGPDEMKALKKIVMSGQYDDTKPAGKYTYTDTIRNLYLTDLTKNQNLNRPIKAVIACGNGTAGAFAPEAFRKIGADIIEIECDLDHSFPHYNPNPEDMKMLHHLSKSVLEHKADIGFAFDGDGDRCGIVDNEGEEIFADKIGLILARYFSELYPGANFVVDVKSTGLFMTDPVLKKNNVNVEYWKTGHSYIKRRTQETNALAGFEKSGHFFFSPPIGRGYDDGLVSALEILNLIDNEDGKKLSDFKKELGKTWASPTMSPYCSDKEKYDIVEKITDEYKTLYQNKKTIAGLHIKETITVNGIRIVFEDGSWGLVRASSNKPNLVIVVESPSSEKTMINIFRDIEHRLKKHPEIGDFDQKI